MAILSSMLVALGAPADNATVVETAESPRALFAGPSPVIEASAITDVARARITHIRIAVEPSAGMGDSTMAACSHPIVSPCTESIALSDPLLSVHMDALGFVTSVAANPGDGRVMAALVTGTRVSTVERIAPPVSRTVLLERDAAGDWTSEELPFLLVGTHQPQVTYVRDIERAEIWNPAVTYERAAADGTRKSMLAKRRGIDWESWEWESSEAVSIAALR